MIVAGGSIGDRELIIIGLDHVNLDKLREGKPATADHKGLPLVVIHAAPTLREVVAELVREKILPAEALEDFTDPEPGESRRWSAGGGGIESTRDHAPDCPWRHGRTTCTCGLVQTQAKEDDGG